MSSGDSFSHQARSREGRGLSVRGGDSDKWITIQKNTFLNWVNLQLQGSGFSVEDFEVDFDNGVKLCALVEALQHKKIGKVIKKPINHHQSLENVSLALKAVADDNIRLVNIGAEDIVDGSLKLILGLVWTLILRYQIGKTKFSPKKLMLAWLKAVVPDCPIRNFTSDWNDGVALSAVIEYCQPGLFPDWRSLRSKDRVENCTKAMTVAKERLNIPMVVRPEDFASPYLDELSGMTYLSYYMMQDSPGYFATRRDIRNILQVGSIDNFTSDWNDGQLLCNLVMSVGGDISGWPNLPNQPEANLQRGLDEAQRLGIEPIFSAKEIADPEVEHLGVMAYAAYFIKMAPVKLRFNPGTLDANLDNTYVGSQKSFNIVLEDGSPENISAELSGPNSHPHVDMSWSGSTAYCSFTPVETGQHKLDVVCNGNSISGSPVHFRVMVDRSLVVFHPPSRACVGHYTDMKVDVSAAGEGAIQVEARSPSGYTKDVSALYRSGVYDANFTPTEVGTWYISVLFDGEHISGSPFALQVFDPSLVRIMDLEGGAVGQNLTFRADATEAGEGDLEVKVKYEGSEVPSYIHSNGNGSYSIDFMPQGAGTYMVYAYFNDMDVKDSPFQLDIVDSARVTLSGEGISLVPVNRVATFTIHTQGAGNAKVDIDIAGPSGEAVDHQVTQVNDSTVHVDYTPTAEGEYKIGVKCDGETVKGSPFICKAHGANKLLISDVPPFSVLGTPVSFHIDTTEAGTGNVDIQVNQGKVSCAVEKVDTHHFSASFLPEGPSPHTLHITLNGQQAEGSPWTIQVLDTQSIHISGTSRRSVPVRKEASVAMTGVKAITGVKDITGVRSLSDQLLVTVTDPNGRDLTFDRRDGMEEVVVSYTPLIVGDHMISVKCLGQDVNGSPVIAKAYDCDAITVTSLEDGFVGQPMSFTINVQAAGEGQLQIMVNGGDLPNEVGQQDVGVYLISFVPVEPGPQTVDILFNDDTLSVSPLTCEAVMLDGEVSDLDDLVPVNMATAFLIKSPRASRLSPDVVVMSPTGEHLDSSLVQTTDGDYRVEWTPKQTGRHSVDVLFGGQQVTGSPFYIEVYDVSKIRVDKFYHGKVEQSAGFSVDASLAGVCQQTVRIMSPSGNTLPVDVSETSPSCYTVNYVPQESGPHYIYLTYNNVEMPGSPYVQDIGEGELPPAYGDGLYKGEEDRSAIFYIDSRGMSGEPSVQVSGPNSMSKCSLDPQVDGQYLVTYVPVEVGMFDVKVTWNSKELPGSPYHPKIVCARKVEVVGGWQRYMDSKERVHLVVNEEKQLLFDVSQAGPGIMTAEVKSPSGEIPVTIDDNTMGRNTLSFIPREEGNHYIHIFWSETPLPNAPFLGYAVTNVLDPSKVILMGRGLKEAVVREESEFTIDASQAGAGEPEVQLTGVRAEVKVEVTPLGGSKFRCVYIPVVPGAYLLHISWNSRPLRGSPFKVNVVGAFYPNKVIVSGEGLKGGLLGHDLDIRIDTRRAGPGELTAYCMGPTKVAVCELEDHRDGTFRLNVRPQDIGNHVLQVRYGGEHVLGSPFNFKVASLPDASKVRVSGPGVEHGILPTFQSRFMVETRGAGAGQLTVRIRGPKGAFQVEMYRDSQRDRTILCRYDPAETGLYIVSVRWSGVDVPGSPFHINILDTQGELEQVLNEQSFQGAAFNPTRVGSGYGSGYAQWK